jgi:hypothetical protein
MMKSGLAAVAAITLAALAGPAVAEVQCKSCEFPGGHCGTIGLSTLDARAQRFQGRYTDQDKGNGYRDYTYDVSGTYQQGVISFKTRFGSRVEMSILPDSLRGNFVSYEGWTKQLTMTCNGQTSGIVVR